MLGTWDLGRECLGKGLRASMFEASAFVASSFQDQWFCMKRFLLYDKVLCNDH